MLNLQLVPSIVAPALIALKSQGWEIEEHMDSAELSLTIIIMLGRDDGISFIAYLEHENAEKCEVFVTEFNKDNSRNKTDYEMTMADSDVKTHEPIECLVANLEAMVAPYRARAYDVHQELHELRDTVNHARLEHALIELLLEDAAEVEEVG